MVIYTFIKTAPQCDYASSSFGRGIATEDRGYAQLQRDTTHSCDYASLRVNVAVCMHTSSDFQQGGVSSRLRLKGILRNSEFPIQSIISENRLSTILTSLDHYPDTPNQAVEQDGFYISYGSPNSPFHPISSDLSISNELGSCKG